MSKHYTSELARSISKSICQAIFEHMEGTPHQTNLASGRDKWRYSMERSKWNGIYWRSWQVLSPEVALTSGIHICSYRILDYILQCEFIHCFFASVQESSTPTRATWEHKLILPPRLPQVNQLSSPRPSCQTSLPSPIRWNHLYIPVYSGRSKSFLFQRQRIRRENKNQIPTRYLLIY